MEVTVAIFFTRIIVSNAYRINFKKHGIVKIRGFLKIQLRFMGYIINATMLCSSFDYA